MALANSLVTTTRNLVNTFGNDSTVYPYSSATKTTSDEGDETITSWGTTAVITETKVVDGINIKSQLSMVMQGMETLGNDSKIFRDDVTISVNDRVNIDGVNYRVIEIQPTRAQSILVFNQVSLTRVDDIINW